MAQFVATIPMSASPYKMGGEAGDPVRITFEINITDPAQYGQLAGLRGKELVLTIHEASH